MWNRSVSALLVLWLVITISVSAKELSPERRLRRLSVHLRGVPPTKAEYRALEEKPRADLAEFFSQKSKEYLQSKEHLGKMIARLDDLFRFRTPSNLQEVPSPLSSELPAGESLNTFDLTVFHAVKSNRSWDELFLSKRVPIFQQNPGTPSQDTSFFQETIPSAVALAVGFHSMEIDPADLRFAGVLTTSRFFGRYGTTNLNKNRGRAAALFRIMLCDDMRAVVEPSLEEESELLKKAFPEGEKPDGFHSGIRFVDDEAKHGSEASCRACHYKLDPLGRAFLTSGSHLSSDASPGRLVFKRADGTVVDIRGRGLAEVTSAILSQSEYARCQVGHFWRWFVRADRSPSDARLNELVQAFEARGRRVNDFIDYLVNEPEFFTEDEAEFPTLNHVRPQLSRCDGCHSGLEGEKFPSFVRFPIGGDQASHLEWMKNIVDRLDLAHNGASKTMPPKESAWQPSSSEIGLLKRWVSAGARGEDGAVSVDLAVAEGWLGISGPIAARPETTFRRTFQRYLSTQDIFRTLRAHFPKAPPSSSTECQLMDVKNRAVFGDANPFNGELVHESIGSGFVRVYGKCLTEFIRGDLEAATYLGEASVKVIKDAGLEHLLTNPKENLWALVPESAIMDAVRHLVRRYIEPNIVTDEERLLKNLFNYQSSELKTRTVFDSLSRLVFIIGTQEAFLAY